MILIFWMYFECVCLKTNEKKMRNIHILWTIQSCIRIVSYVFLVVCFNFICCFYVTLKAVNRISHFINNSYKYSYDSFDIQRFFFKYNMTSYVLCSCCLWAILIRIDRAAGKWMSVHSKLFHKWKYQLHDRILLMY